MGPVGFDLDMTLIDSRSAILAAFAGLAAKTGRHRMALRLTGAAEACRDTYESALPEPNRAYLESWL